MTHTSTSHPYHLPVYLKAMEIFSLSRKISFYLRDDLAFLKHDGSENNDIYFTGDIVRQSESLAPEILKAEFNSESKHIHAKTLEWLTFRLNKTCKRLEHINSNGKDFIPILRKEIKQFRRLQRSWMLTL